MFSLRSFVKSGFLKAVGKIEDYQIILSACEWMEKGVLKSEDLEEIQEEIETQKVVTKIESEQIAPEPFEVEESE